MARLAVEQSASEVHAAVQYEPAAVPMQGELRLEGPQTRVTSGPPDSQKGPLHGALHVTPSVPPDGAPPLPESAVAFVLPPPHASTMANAAKAAHASHRQAKVLCVTFPPAASGYLFFLSSVASGPPRRRSPPVSVPAQTIIDRVIFYNVIKFCLT